MTAYDALLLVSFGGPERPEEVMPFLENVTRGRGVPRERLEDVAEHYHHLGGASPINAQNRSLRAAIERDLAEHGIDLPVYWGNRVWHPFLAETLQTMTDAGVRRALAFVTAAYASYSGCRQYREALAAARAEVGAHAPLIDKVRLYFNHPGFVDTLIGHTVAALERLPEDVRQRAHLTFTTHSIPLAQAASSGPDGDAYVAQHRETARLVADGVRRVTGVPPSWDLVYQSRSGPPSQPWLEPDILDHLPALAARGVPGVVIVPIGFLSDHVEVAYDLDVEALARAGELGLSAVRADTVGTDPRFVAMVRELVLERLNDVDTSLRRSVGVLGPSHDVCPVHCCANPRGHRPAVAEEAG